MATKSFTFQVEADPELEAALWEAHVKWNEAMRRTIQYIFKGLRGQCGETPEERAGWQKLMFLLKDSNDGKTILHKCENPNYTSRPRPHKLDHVWHEIKEAESLIGGTPWEKPVDWMRRINENAAWRRPYFEDVVDIDEIVKLHTNRYKKKPRKERLATGKKVLNEAERLHNAFRKSNAFREISNRLKSDDMKSTRISLGRCSMFDKDEVAPGFGSAERYKVYDASAQVLRSYWELRSAWNRDHQEWLNKKKEWEQKNEEYMNFYKKIMDEFWNTAGQGYVGSERWNKFLEFLRSKPELTAFGGKGDGLTIQEPDPDELARELKEHYRRNRKASATAIQTKALLRANPGMLELNRIDTFYREVFLRERCKRKHDDNYALPPSFTLPHPLNHPHWMEFQRAGKNSKNNGYTQFSLDGETGRLLLRLPSKGKWYPVRFRGGSRAIRFEKLPNIEDYKGFPFRFRDTRGESYLVQPKGIKIIFKNVHRLRARAEYPGAILLSVTMELLPESPKSLDKDIVCAMDLGIHTPAALTVMHGDKIIAVRIIRDKDLKASTNTTNLRATKRRLADSRRKSREEGPPIEGHADRFQKHLNDSADDRIKKLVNKVLSFAIAHRAGTLAIENLSGLYTTSARLRVFNRSISGWLRGRMVEYLKVQAKAHGITVCEVDAYNTSRICHKCGKLGCRYERRSGEPPLIRPVGPLFVCSHIGCLMDYNADVNASFNLHKVHAKRFPKRERLTDEEYKELREICLDRLTNAVVSKKDDLIF